jgi:hypothetical protein
VRLLPNAGNLHRLTARHVDDVLDRTNDNSALGTIAERSVVDFCQYGCIERLGPG